MIVQLQSIRIERFRGIREGSIEDIADVNLLIGRNNSGKSTIAEALCQAVHLLTGGAAHDPLGRPLTSAWESLRGGKFPAADSWYQQDMSKPILLALTMSDGVQKSEHSLTVQKDGGWSGSIVDEPDLQFARSMKMLRPPDGGNPQIENTLWPRLLANRGDKYLTQAMNDIFQLNADGFQLLPDRRLMVLYEDHGLPLDLQGDGTRTALRFLTVLACLRETLLIVEEAEAYQHPGSLQRLATTFCKQGKERSVQLLITTHSAECVRMFLDAAKAAGSTSAVFHLSLEDGRLDTRRLEADTVNQLAETGLDVRFLDLYA